MQSNFQNHLKMHFRGHQKRPTILDNIKNLLMIGGKYLKIVFATGAKYLKIK